MKIILLALTICSLSHVFAEPLAVGEVTRSVQTEYGNFYHWTFKVSKIASPGIRFYPLVRFVLDDETWIGGGIDCYPVAAPVGSKSGGRVSTRNEVPEGRKLMYVDVVAAIGDPKDSLFGIDRIKQGEVIPHLTEETLTELKKQGGVVIRFPIKNAEQASADQPTNAPELKSEGGDKPQPESKIAPR